MKKLLAFALCTVLLTAVFAGCGEKKSKNNESLPDTSSNGTVSDTVKGFDGKIGKKWEDVKDDFASEERKADAEVSAMATVTRADVEAVVYELKNGLKELENGVTDKNEGKAKEVYKNAHKLEIMAKKGDVEAAKEFSDLARNAKALVKQYYGVAEEDYDTLQESVRKGIDKIENFTDDIWNAFVDLFK